MKLLRANELDIDVVAKSLKQGATLVYPTETCYGLGCDAANAVAVDRVYEIKARPREKSLILLADSLAMMAPYIVITSVLEQLAARYWPGALTVVVPLRAAVSLPAGVVSEDGTIAFRVSSHPIARLISQGLGRPLVSTSANLAGQPPLYRIADVIAAFTAAAIQPDFIIDAGDLPVQPPSTVVRVQGEKITVLRPGGVIYRGLPLPS